jgi:flagellar hook-basal body complex protein FliE
MPHPDFEWQQDGESQLEIRVPLASLKGPIVAKDLHVQVKEDDVIVVTHKDVVVLQQRVHDNVTLGDWTVENGSHLVMDFIKSEPESWPCLLRLPMRSDDRRFLRGDALDSLLRTEMFKLPRDPQLEAEAKGASTGPTNDEDFDDLLDDALDEVVKTEKQAAADANADDEGEDPITVHGQAMIDYELKMTVEEFEQLDTLRKEAEEKIASPETSEEDREKQRERLEVIAKMTEVSKTVRRLRSKRPTIPVLLDILAAEIYKGRLNTGSVEEHEKEAFRDAEEQAMTPDALMKKGIVMLETNVQDAMHYLRLAAIHHNHAVSTCLLHRLYSQTRLLPKAAYFVFRRALMDDCEPSTNLIVGEYVDKGMPLFPPYMALVVYFYQRSASVGSTHAMLTLASTFKNGAVTASAADEQSRKRNADEDRFLEWLQAAEDRGSPRAYFIRASLHTTGECGQTKSYKLAKEYLDRVKKTEPSILQKAPGLEARVHQMGREEAVKEGKPLAGTPTTPANASPLSSAPASSAGRAAALTRAQQPAASRLEALERAAQGNASAHMDTAPRRGGMLSKPRGAAAASNKWKLFWEKSLKWSLGIYGVYCLMFPIRVMIAPYAFLSMANFMEIFGLGNYIHGGRADPMQGGMF